MEKRLNYATFHVHAVNEEDGEFMVESINSLTDLGGRLHSVIPKIENGTTTGYLVIVEYQK